MQIAVGKRPASIVRVVIGTIVVVMMLLQARTVLLFRGAQKGNVLLVKMCLAAGASVDSLSFPHRETPLMNAAAEGEEQILRLLIGRGARVDIVSGQGETALDRAARMGRTSAVRTLVENGASLENGTPLLISLGEGHLDSAAVLIDEGANVNAEDTHGDTALIYCAKSSAPIEFVRKLIAAGAQVQHKNRAGLTAAMVASENGRQDIVDLVMTRESFRR